MCHSTVMQCMTFMHALATRAAEHLPEVDAAARWRARIAMRSIVAERVCCRTCRTNATGAVLSISDAAYMITIHIALDELSCRQGYAVGLLIHGPADLHNFCPLSSLSTCRAAEVSTAYGRTARARCAFETRQESQQDLPVDVRSPKLRDCKL